MTEEQVNRPVEVPVPADDEDDGSLVVDDVLKQMIYLNLPESWIVANAQMELADAWVVQNLRKNEASERAMTSDERAHHDSSESEGADTVLSE